MKAKHSFYKEDDGIWYIDLPEYLDQGLGTQANLMMVGGADTFLDYLSNNTGKITLEISDGPFEGHTDMISHMYMGIPNLEELGHPIVPYGGYYYHKPKEHRLWLCPVTEYVFGGSYPNKIYFRIIN